MMERRNGYSKALRAVTITLAMAGFTVATTPSAHAVSWLYQFVCEDILHYFDHSVKRADKAIEKFGWARRGFLELGSERLPGGYGTLLKQYYENYFRECETLLEALAAMAKRAVTPEQGEIVLQKIGQMRSAALTPSEVDDTMNWVIAKMKKVNADPAIYEKMKRDYADFYAQLFATSLGDTKIDSLAFLEIHEKAFLARFERGRTTDLKAFEGIVEPERNPMYSLLQDLNREAVTKRTVEISEEVYAEWNRKLALKWFRLMDSEFGRGNYRIYADAVNALFLESLKAVTMGSVRYGHGYEINPHVTSVLVLQMVLHTSKDWVARLGPEAELLAKRIEAYGAAMKKLPMYEGYGTSSLPENLHHLAERLRSGGA